MPGNEVIGTFTIGTNAFELHGSNTWEFTGDGVTCERIFRVSYANKLAFVEACLGSVTEDNDGNLVRIEPIVHPEADYLVAGNARIEPLDLTRSKFTASQSVDAAEYDWARVTIIYGSADFNFGPGATNPFITEQVNFSGEFTTDDRGKGEWKFGSTSGPRVTNKVVRFVGIVEDSIVLHRAPRLNRDTIKSQVGTVNNAAFFDTPKGSMLFRGGRARRVTDNNGTQTWQLEYQFSTRRTARDGTQDEDAWQKVWQTHPVSAWTVVVDANGNKPYAESNFANLFQGVI